MMRQSTHQLNGPMRAQGGFSLVEMMVAGAISLMLLAGLISIVISSNRSYGELNKTSRQLENGRYALDLIRKDVEHAGFYGLLTDIDFYDTPPSSPDSCDEDLADIQANMALPIYGYNGPSGTNPAGAGCSSELLSDANHLDGTDILVIRRTERTSTATGSLNTNRLYLEALPTDFASDIVLDTGTVANFTRTLPSGAAAPLWRFVTHIYYIAPCSVPSSGSTCDANADGGNPIPTLKRLELGSDLSGPDFEQVPLVEGIEELQIDYARDEDGDGTVDSYTAAPTASQWNEVVAVRIHILARNIEPTPGYAVSKVFNLGIAGTVAKTDEYKRSVFTAVIRAKNISGRRE